MHHSLIDFCLCIDGMFFLIDGKVFEKLLILKMLASLRER